MSQVHKVQKLISGKKQSSGRRECRASSAISNVTVMIVHVVAGLVSKISCSASTSHRKFSRGFRTSTETATANQRRRQQ